MSPTIPKTMKAAVAEKPGDKLVVKQVPVPEAGPHQLLVKVHTCGVCHSDSIAISGGMGSPFPLIPGHEIVATVVELGEGVTRFKEGDLVGGAWHGGHDGTCRSCQRGLFQMCENESINGVTKNGGYAEYAVLNEEAAVRLPGHLDKAEMAPLLCAGITVFNAMRQQKIEAGGTVAVVGLGGLGHLAIQYARKMGFRTVALSSSDSKKDFASQLGATDYLSGDDQAAELQKIGGADLIIITAPNPKIIGPLVAGLAPKGKIILLAPVGDVTLPTIDFILKGLTFGGWPSGHALDSEEAIAFAERQGVKTMIEKFPLDKVNEAFDRMLSGKVRFRGVLVIDES